MSEKQDYLRQTPRQKRSLARFHHILDTADRLFAAQGYDKVSTNHIAEAAEVAIGSVYHFFPNKDAVLQALVERYRDRLAAVFPEQLAPPRRVSDIVTEMLDNLMEFPDSGLEWMLTLTDGNHFADTFHELHNQIVIWVESMLAVQFPTLKAEERHICALAGVAIIKGMMPLAAPPFNLGVERLKVEAHTALLGYLGRFLARNSIQAEL